MQSAINPQTGEVLFLVNNQWVPPAQQATNPKTGEMAYLVGGAWQIMPGENPVVQPPAQAPAQPIAQPPAQPVAPTSPQAIDPGIASLLNRYPAPQQAVAEPPPVDDFDARLAAQEKKRQEFAPGEELGKGFVGMATVGLPNLWENVGVMKDAGVAATIVERQKLADKIKAGEITSSDQLRGNDSNTSWARSYLGADPAMREKLDARNNKELASRKDFIQASAATIAQYQKEMQKYAPRQDKLLEIDWTKPQAVKDFTNWLAHAAGSGVASMGPIMLAAAIPGVGPALATGVGVGMGAGEAVGNRIEAVQKQTQGLPPEQQAEAIADYVAKTNDVNLIVGVISGVLDVALGPVAHLVKNSLKHKAGKEIAAATRAQAMKQSIKTVPGQVLEEGVAGAGQEAAQIGGEFRTGEKQGDVFTKENAKRVFESSMKEAAGGFGGAGVNVGIAGLRTPQGAVTPPAQPKPRIEPTFDETPPAAPPTPPKPPTARDQKITEMAQRLEIRGLDPEEALAVATRQVDEDIATAETRLETAAGELPKYPQLSEDKRVQAIAEEFLDAGMPPAEALATAINQAAAEKEANIAGKNSLPRKPKNAPNTGQYTGSAGIAGAVNTANGAGNGVAVQPPTATPTEGSGESGATGVVPTGQNAGDTTGGEVGAPPTVEAPTTPSPTKTKKPKAPVEEVPDTLKSEGITPEIYAAGKKIAALESENPTLRTNPDDAPAKGRRAHTTAYNKLIKLVEAAGLDPLKVVNSLVGHFNSWVHEPTVTQTQPPAQPPAVETQPPAQDMQSAIIDMLPNLATEGVELIANKPDVPPQTRAAAVEELNRRKNQPTGEQTSVTQASETQQTTQEGQAPAGAEPTGKKRGRPATLVTEEQKEQNKQERNERQKKVNRDSRRIEALKKAFGKRDSKYSRSDAIWLAAHTEKQHRGSAFGKRVKAYLQELNATPEEIKEALKAAPPSESGDPFADMGALNDISENSTQEADNTAETTYAGYERQNVAHIPVSRILNKLTAQKESGAITAEEFEREVAALAHRLATNAEAKKENRENAPKARGVDRVLEVLLAARRRGELDPDMVEFAKWLLDKNPQLASQLGISVVSPNRGSPAGRYTSIARVMTLFKGKGNIGTAVHEILHHAERMMPQVIQDGIRRAWAKAFAKGYDAATPEQRKYLDLMLDATAGDAKAAKELVNGFRSGVLSYDTHYQLTNPSEYWAVNATRIMQGRFEAGSWMAKAKQWMRELVQKMRGILGMDSDYPVLKALDSVINGDGSFQSTKMLGEAAIQQAIDPNKIPPGTLSKTAAPDERSAKEVDTAVDTAEETYTRSKNAKELAKGVSLAQLANDASKLVGVIRRLFTAGTTKQREAISEVITTDYLAELASKDVPELTNTNKLIQEMHGKTARLLEGAANTSDALFNGLRENPDLRTPLEQIVIESTLAEVDPSTDKRNAKLNALYNKLGAKGQKLYNELKTYYSDMSALYGKLLDDQINELGVSSEAKKNLLTKVRALYEAAGKISPYFPLVRKGEYWLRVSNGKDKPDFYMCESIQARDVLAEEIAKERRSSYGEMKADGLFVVGNNIRSLRMARQDYGTPLTSLFDLVDAMDMADPDARNSLKDGIYQLYLMSMPDQSFRKQFINRKGLAGFETDLLQNFSSSAVTMSVQLARIQYASKIQRSVKTAYESARERPEVTPYIDAMQERVDLELPRGDRPEGSKAAKAAVNFATRAAFVNYLSSAASAILQPLSVFQFAVPLLSSRHGFTATMTEMSKMMKVWNAYAISKKNPIDGSTSWMMPSIRNSDAVQKSQLEKRAMDKMVGRNIGQITLAGELLARKNNPTDVSLSKTRNAGKNLWWAVSGGMLMHAGERIAQEMVFLTSFRLSRRNALNEFRKTPKYLNSTDRAAEVEAYEKRMFDAWVDQAVMDTHESLGNMTPENRPPVMRSTGGKLLTQFNMFPLHATILVSKNFFRMLLAPTYSGATKAQRWEATKTFFGVMGTTWMLGGLVALPLISTLAGFIGGMWDDKKKDAPEEMKDLDFFTWFRKIWLPEQLGTDWARIAEYGPTNFLTGLDISSRISLDNMYFRESNEARNPRAAGEQFIVEHAGPSVTQGLTYLDGYNAFKNGDYRAAIEKFAPAVLRNPLVAERYSEEGAEDTKGNLILDKDAFTTGRLLWQAIGFRSDELADVQGVNHKVMTQQQRMLNQRNQLQNNLDRVFRKGDLAGQERFLDEMADFNVRHPEAKITGEQYIKSLEARNEARAKSWRGVTLKPEEIGLYGDVLDASHMYADKAEAKGAKK